MPKTIQRLLESNEKLKDELEKLKKELAQRKLSEVQVRLPLDLTQAIGKAQDLESTLEVTLRLIG